MQLLHVRLSIDVIERLLLAVCACRRAYCSHGDALFPPLWLAAVTLLTAAGFMPFSLLLLAAFTTFPLGMQLIAVKAAGLKPSQLPGSRLMPSFVASMELLTLGVVLWGLVPAAWFGNAAACIMLVVAVGLTAAFHVRTYFLDPGYVPLDAEGEGEVEGGSGRKKNIWEASGVERKQLEQQQQQGERAEGGSLRKVLGAVPLTGPRADDSQRQQQVAEQQVQAAVATGQPDLASLVDHSGAAAAVQIVPAAGRSTNRSSSGDKGVMGSPNGKAHRPGAAVAVKGGGVKVLSLGAAAAVPPAAGAAVGAGAGSEITGELASDGEQAPPSGTAASKSSPFGAHGSSGQRVMDIDSCWTCGVKRPLRSKHCPYCRYACI